MQQLQSGTTLQGGKYKIIKVLGQGGFGITYLAVQVMLGRRVAIKEFFMKDYCNREEATRVTMGTSSSREMVSRYCLKFIKEARIIAGFNHPNIVRIIDVFCENDTAYYVMNYIEGGSLSDKLHQTGAMSEPQALRYIVKVADALQYVHNHNMNHLDVKPANIMLTAEGDVVLIDFGLSKHYDENGGQTSSAPIGFSDGYAPMEQYNMGGVDGFSPQTDVYSLGATLYKLLTNVTPPSAMVVNEEGLPLAELKRHGVSQHVVSAIVRAMQSRRKDRMKSASAFAYALHTGSATDDTTVLVDKCVNTSPRRQYTAANTGGKRYNSRDYAPKSDNSNRNAIIAIVVITLGVITIIAGIVTYLVGVDSLRESGSEIAMNDSTATVEIADTNATATTATETTTTEATEAQEERRETSERKSRETSESREESEAVSVTSPNGLRLNARHNISGYAVQDGTKYAFSVNMKVNEDGTVSGTYNNISAGGITFQASGNISGDDIYLHLTRGSARAELSLHYDGGGSFSGTLSQGAKNLPAYLSE